MHPNDVPLLDLPGKPSDHRVVVAMSGGVDSSVVAAILHHQGYDVVGITLQLYDHGAAIQKKGACCAGQDIYDARKVADQMGFPHFVLDYENKFKDSVIDKFVDSYLAGSTPIPCVECNMEVKFKDLLAAAKDFGASAMATGHYIQRKAGAVKNELHRGIDLNRDQSYFLYGTTQEQLDYLHFPLGGLVKSQTRKLAEHFGLIVSDKPDSQDICFVPDGKYSDVIIKKRPDALKEGDIYHIDGTHLGRHRGIVHYTIGQRRGLGLPGGTGDPLFVIKLDADENRVYVGPEDALKRKNVFINQLNWIGDTDIPIDGMEVAVKLRSTREPKKAVIYPAGEDGMIKVHIPEGEKSVSPGQAAVFYKNDANFSRLLGGGKIFASDNQ